MFPIFLKLRTRDRFREGRMFWAQDGRGGGKGAGIFFTESPRVRGEL